MAEHHHEDRNLATTPPNRGAVEGGMGPGNGHGDGHTHDPGHGHGHNHPGTTPPPVRQDDPAAQSLGDALRVSFALLKIAMVVLIAVYLFSGVFRVEENTVGVKLVFGQIAGEAERGLNFNWPYPIGDEVIVPLATRQLQLNDEYWYQLNERDIGRSLDDIPGGPLNPIRDGSLITGDANLVHGRFTVTYRVDDSRKFVSNVGLSEIGDPLPGAPDDVLVMLPDQKMAMADLTVRRAAEQAIIRAVAATPADSFIAGIFDATSAVGEANRVLEDMQTGLRVVNIVAQPAMPLSVRSAYQAVVNAESERAELIEQAQQERARVLGETAGQAATALRDMIDDYELARTAQDTARAAELEQMISEALSLRPRNPDDPNSTLVLQMPEAYGGQIIGGEAARVINEATSFATTVVEDTKSQADTFRSLLTQYRENPDLLKTKLGKRALADILGVEAADIEVFYTVDGAPYIEMNRDPELARERERRRIEQEQQRAQERSQQNR